MRINPYYVNRIVTWLSWVTIAGILIVLLTGCASLLPPSNGKRTVIAPLPGQHPDAVNYYLILPRQ